MAKKENYLGKNALAHLKLLLENAFQKKEHKTGSESEYKVLSDNNLTDELVQKIKDAGSSSFDGQFNSLKGIPTLDGTEIKGTLTKEDLGIASTKDIPTDNKSLTNGAGYQTSSDVEKAITSKGYKTSDDIEQILSEKDYKNSTQVEEIITSKGYQTSSEVELAIEEKGYQTESQVTTAINKAVANINKKQVVASTEEMTDENTIYLMSNSGAGNNVYDEYIVVEGTPEKIGTTEVDLTGYLREEDLTELTNEEIDEIFNS